MQYVLTGRYVSLLPMERSHFEALCPVACDDRIWQHTPYKGGDPESFRKVFDSAMAGKDAGTRSPFVIYHTADRKLAGSTSIIDHQAKHRKAEIGATWLHPGYWGTVVNAEAKLLLLTHCFEVMGLIRVQLKTDENNLRSRKAIEKIGARFEGVLRNDMIRDDGTFRNSAYFSIILPEWNGVKQRLAELVANTATR